MRHVALMCALLLGSAGISALAQQAPQPPDPAAMPPSAPASPGAAAPAGAGAPGKRGACQEAARARGLKGHDLADEVQLCSLQGRLDCLKQAIAAKKYGPDRQAFIKACAGVE